jgi:serine protease
MMVVKKKTLSFFLRHIFPLLLVALVLGCSQPGSSTTQGFIISGSVTFNAAGLAGVTLSAGSASATTNSSGNYTITVPAVGSYTVTPALGSYVFSPGSQTATVSLRNPTVSGLNFTATVGIYSLFGLWSSPNQSDMLTLVTTSSRTPRAVPQRLHIRKFSKVSSSATTDRVIVRYKNGVLKSQDLSSRVLRYGRIVQRVATSRLTFDAIKIDISGGRTINDALAYYRSLPEVAYAEPDGIVYAQGTPNDTDFSEQWDLIQLNMPSVWNTVTGIPSVVVAVVDTGLYRGSGTGMLDSPANIQLGYNARTQTADTTAPFASDDDNGHGTHVSGTIDEATNNNEECAGMAYGVTLLPVKVLGQDGSGYDSDVAAGIEWAITQTPKPAVINMSLGQSSPDATLQAAVEDAYNAGVAVFAAAGNDGSDSVDYPAAYQPYVLSVGATGYNKELAYYSNYGPLLDVVAPGGDDSVFASTSPNYYEDWIWQETIGGYNDQTGLTDYTEGVYGYEGTSMATPHVSALAALLVCQNSSLTPAQIYDRIERTADSLGAANTYGYGLIDPAAAVGAASGSYDRSQTVTGPVQVTTPPSYTFNSAANSAVKFTASLTKGSGSLTLKLYDSNNNLLSSSSTSQTTLLSYTLTAAGTYRIEVDYSP